MSASEIHICGNCGYSERDPFDRQREEALDLVRIARMSMNPQVHADWMARASCLLEETSTIPLPQNQADADSAPA